MKTFNLSAEVTISIYTEVEAETLEQAIEMASERPIEAYRFGNKTQQKEAWINGDYDGEPKNIHES